MQVNARRKVRIGGFLVDNANIEGTEVYDVSVLDVVAKGSEWDNVDLERMIVDGVLEILWDTQGVGDIKRLAQDLLETEFSRERIEQMLATTPALEPWRVSEAIAESFFVTCRGCMFPWPTGRDLKNPSGSPSGADLVGFSDFDGSTKFAFGEVKSSSETAAPPNVMYGRTGLTSQLERLKDSDAHRDALVKYLGFRASGSIWEQQFKSAFGRYLRNPHDFALLGFLIRDVAPNAEDLRSRSQTLAANHPAELTIEVRAKYLPAGTLSILTDKVLELARDAGYA